MLTESTPLRAPLKPAAADATGASTSSGGTSGSIHAGKATLLSAIANTAGSMLGSGLVVLPHAFAQAGWALGLAMMSVAAAVAIVTSDFISEAVVHVDRGPSFRAISNAAVPHLSLVSDAAVILTSVGSGCVYVIVASDNLQSVLYPDGPRWLWVLLILIVVTPLSFIRTVDALRFTSLAAAALLVYILLLVVVFAIGGAISPNGDFHNATDAFNGTHFRKIGPNETLQWTASSIIDPCPPDQPS